MSRPFVRRLLAIVALAGALSGCESYSDKHRELMFRGQTMGPITYTVKVVDLPESISREDIANGIETRLKRVDSLMSTYRADSELSKFNTQSGDDWFEVSPDTAAVFQTALKIGELTHGALDVTVGPLVELWNFGPDKQADDPLPSAVEIAAARERTGLKKIELRKSPPAVRKTRADVSVDLSAVAKGFAVDQIAEYLMSLGVKNFMVEVGGEVRTGGHNLYEMPWGIAIETPIPNTDPTPEERNQHLQRVAPLSGKAMATSGDYRNYYTKGQRRYSHLIDPRTGEPVRHSLVSVSVVCNTCVEADAWATGLLVLGPEDGYKIAEENGLAVLFIEATDAGFHEHPTPAFAKDFEK